jgi:hypothetical protein
MNHRLFTPLTLFVLALSLSSYAQEAKLIGAWEGTLDLPGTKLRIVFNVRRATAGGLTGSMDSPDQGAKNIPMTVSPSKDAAVQFLVPGVGSYEGKLDAAGTRISGLWKQGPADLALTLEKTDPAKAGKPLPRKANPESVEANKKTDGKLVGVWEGTLHAGTELRVVFHLTETNEGGLLGTFDSLDQGAKDIPITSIVYKEPNIRLETKTIGGAFEGQLKNSELTGNWQQIGNTLPLTLKKKK